MVEVSVVLGGVARGEQDLHDGHGAECQLPAPHQVGQLMWDDLLTMSDRLGI